MKGIIFRDRFIGFCVALGIHATILFSAREGLIEQAQFGMVASTGGGFETDLVAALPGESSGLTHTAQTITSPDQLKIQMDEEIIYPDLPELKKYSVYTDPLGAGSFSIPNNDSITLQNGVSRFSQSRPGYYRNSPPYYPEQAKQQGQEGLVILHVVVSDQGKAKTVELKKSSGFSLLDEVAGSAVKEWKFKPARINKINIESEVEVPIRFKLD